MGGFKDLNPLVSKPAKDFTLGMTMTKGFEGFKSYPYKDTKGVSTIGYGFNMPANKITQKFMSQQEADKRFAPLYQSAEKRAVGFVGKTTYESLTPVQQYILNDMSYNLGNRIFGFKNMKSAIQKGDMETTKKEMKNSKWYKEVGRRSIHHIENWGK